MLNGKSIEEWLATNRVGLLQTLSSNNLNEDELKVVAEWRSQDTNDTVLQIIAKENFIRKSDGSFDQVAKFFESHLHSVLSFFKKLNKDYSSALNNYNSDFKNLFNLIVESDILTYNWNQASDFLESFIDLGCYYRAMPYDPITQKSEYEKQNLFFEILYTCFDRRTHVKNAVNLLLSHESLEWFRKVGEFSAIPQAVGHCNLSDEFMIFLQTIKEPKRNIHLFEFDPVNENIRFKYKIAPEILTSVQIFFTEYCKIGCKKILETEGFHDKVKKFARNTQKIAHLVKPGQPEQNLFKFLANLQIMQPITWDSGTILSLLAYDNYYKSDLHVRFLQGIVRLICEQIDDNARVVWKEVKTNVKLIEEIYANEMKAGYKNLPICRVLDKFNLISTDYFNTADTDISERRLHVACSLENEALFKLLLKSGLSPNILDRENILLYNSGSLLDSLPESLSDKMRDLLKQYMLCSKKALIAIKYTGGFGSFLGLATALTLIVSSDFENTENVFRYAIPAVTVISFPSMTLFAFPHLLPDSIGYISRTAEQVCSYLGFTTKAEEDRDIDR